MPIPWFRAQITTAWEEAEADVGKHTSDALLEIAPGEEILDTLFIQYTGRHYNKRVQGPEIAAAMSPPEELAELFRIFTSPSVTAKSMGTNNWALIW